MTLSVLEPTTNASAAILVARGLEFLHCDVPAVFASAGLDLSQVYLPDMRVSFPAMQRLWARAVEASGDACFGLTAAEHMQPSALHGLGFSWLASDTLHQALQRLVRFSRIISTAVEIRLEQGEGVFELTVQPADMKTDWVPAAADAGMAVFTRMCRIASTAELNPVRVTLQHEEPPCAHRFYRFFASPVEFSSPRNTLWFDCESLEVALPLANAELARINEQTVIDYLARFDRSNIAMQVRARIIEHLPMGPPSQSSIAQSLNMSLRNLQRRLHEEDTSYKSLLDETRRELAAQYIRESRRSISEITYLLGFSEPTNFTRAFKRWTGVSPQEYRKG
jgi:AraC-like DNA-binding protein